MRVVVIDAHGWFFGSAQTNLYLLAKEFKEHKVNMFAILGSSGDLKSALEDEGTKTYTIAMPPPRLPVLAYNISRVGFSIFRLIRRLKPSIVQINEPISLIYSFLPIRLTGTPVVIHARKNPDTLESVLWHLSDGIIVSTHVAPPSIPMSLWDRTHIVGIPIDFQRFSPAISGYAKAELNIPEGAYVVGTVLRITPRRVLNHLIKVAEIIAQRRDDVFFVVVGDEPTRTGFEISRLRRLAGGVGKKFRFTGFRDDVQNLMSIFDVFVSISSFEPSGRNILEAQAMGIPVVATKVGVAEELIEDGETGVLINFGNINKIASEILRILEDDELKVRMKMRAAERVREKFPQGSYSVNVLRAYECAMRRKR